MNLKNDRVWVAVEIGRLQISDVESFKLPILTFYFDPLFNFLPFLFALLLLDCPLSSLSLTRRPFCKRKMGDIKVWCIQNYHLTYPLLHDKPPLLSISMMRQWRIILFFFSIADRHIIWGEVVNDVFLRYCASGARFLFLSSCNCADNYERGGTIDGAITSSMAFYSVWWAYRPQQDG